MAGENPKFSDKKIIGVDLDGVVCNLWDPFRREVLMKTGIDLPRDIPMYNPEECSKLTREQMENILKQRNIALPNLSANAKPENNAEKPMPKGGMTAEDAAALVTGNVAGLR